MARTLIVVSSYDPGYLRISEHLVASAVLKGSAPLVLDVSGTSASPVDSYHRGTLSLFGLKYPGHDLETRLAARGARVLRINEVLEEAPDVDLNEDAEIQLETAIRSALITFYRTEAPDERKRSVARTRTLLNIEGRSVYRAITYLLGKYDDIVEVDVPNGRFPNQKMSTLAAHDRSIATMHFEKGETPNGAYLQSYAPQSRLVSQANVEPVLEGLTETQINGIADEWLSHRVPSKESRNEFSALWVNGLPTTFTADKSAGVRIAGFFTSSQDEYHSLGPEWQLHSWASQFEAFDAALTVLEDAGYRCYIRVHPNLATKAHDSFKREREGIRRLQESHPRLLVIWHDDFANTYALLDQTDVVVAWDSTVGLEASARGIPVWTMATSRYGLTADVHEILSPTDLAEDGLKLWKVNPHAAKRFIAYMVRRDSQMPQNPKPWEPWATHPLPFGVKLSRVLVSGGNPTPSAAIRSLFDVYRHRRNKSNIRSLLGR